MWPMEADDSCDRSERLEACGGVAGLGFLSSEVPITPTSDSLEIKSKVCRNTGSGHNKSREQIHLS